MLKCYSEVSIIQMSDSDPHSTENENGKVATLNIFPCVLYNSDLSAVWCIAGVATLFV